VQGRRGTLRRALLALTLATLWLAVTASGAGAHALVRSSDPPAGASLERPPRAVLLTFTEAPDPTLSSIQVLDASGRAVQAGPAAAEPGRPLQLQVPLGRLTDGTYTVSWRAVSRVDGHVTRGALAFGVGTGVGVTAPPVQPAAPPATSAPEGLALAGRWALYWGLALLVGATATGLLVLGGRLPPAARPLLWAAMALAVTGFAAVVLAEWSAVGVPFGALVASGPGRALVREAVALVLAGGAVGVLLARPQSRSALVSVGVTAAVAMGAHAAGGHAAGQSSLRAGNLLVQWTHLVAVGTWIGGLVWLLAGLRGRNRPDQVAAVVRFSRLAAPVLAVVVLTGLARAAGEVGSPQRLLTTSFGRTLLVKLGLVAVLLALAAANRYRTVPALTAGAGTLGMLRRVVRGELAVAASILVAAALLSELPPAAFVTTAAARAPALPVAVVASGHDYATSVRLTLTVTPGLAGPNTFTARVVDYDHQTAVQARRVALRFALPDRPELGTSALELTRVGDGLWRGQGSMLSLRGRWAVTALVQAPAGAVTVPLQVQTRIPPELLQPPQTSGPPPPDPPDAVVLGGRAGSALVGLTTYARGGLLLVRVRGGLGIPPAIVPTSLRLRSPHGQAAPPLDTRRCGDGCLQTLLAAPAAGRYTVEATFPKGTARFPLPIPLPRPAADRLRAADRTLAGSGSYRLHEVLDSGLGTVVRSDYVLKAPDRARWQTNTGAETADTVWIGEDRYTRQGTGPWKKETTPGLTLLFPARNWSDREANVVDLGPARIGTTPVTVLAFIDSGNGAYHRLWVDRANRILRERMDAPGHFMDRDYSHYGAAVTITPPPIPASGG
jgi:copper transport protein